MFVRRLLQLNLIVSIIVAIVLLIAPKPTLAFYGISGNKIFYVIVQYFATTHVAFAILLWLSLRKNEPLLLRIIVVSFFAGDLAGSLVLFIAQVRGQMNTFGWALVGFSLLFAFGYGYGALKKLPV